MSGPDGGYWRPPTDAERAKKEAKAKEYGDAAKRQAEIYANAWRAIQGDIDATSGNARGDGNLSGRSIRDFSNEELLAASGSAFGGANLGQFGEYEDIRAERLDASIAAAKELMAHEEQDRSLLASVFGPIEEFDMYAAGFDLLKTASQSAFAAWIDGSMSAGEAFKKAAIDSLKANAVQLLGTGLTSVGTGIVHLAMGNPKGPGEIAAGAKAIAQAAVVGGLARSLGGGGGSTGASSGSSSNSYAAAGIGGGPQPTGNTGGTHNVFIIGDPLGYESPRSQAQRVRRSLDLADERTRSSRSVAYS